MAIKIMLAVPTLNRLDRLTEMLASVAASTRQPDKVLLVNNGHQITGTHREEWRRQFTLDIFTPDSNLGVAGSVNYAMRNTPDGWWYLHSNDDVIIDPQCISKLADAAEITEPTPPPLGACFLVPEHADGSAFTVFLEKGLKGVVGYFDEQFYPAYFEDGDFGRRMNLIGVKRTLVKDAFYEHFTSSTLHAYTDDQKRKHHDQFRANLQKYVAKWGGEQDRDEKFNIPYNGQRGHTLEGRHRWHEL